MGQLVHNFWGSLISLFKTLQIDTGFGRAWDRYCKTHDGGWSVKERLIKDDIFVAKVESYSAKLMHM